MMNTNTKERANKLTMTATDNGYMARFYRTHKLICEFEVEVAPNEKGEIEHNNGNRESARLQAINIRCSEYGIEWNPDGQTQAWDRKHAKYFTDEDVSEDAKTLLTLGLNKLMSKVNKVLPMVSLNGISFVDISANESTLAYIIDGKYEKDNSWAYATISMEVILGINEIETNMPIEMQLVSGQIKKLHMTATDLIAMIREEAELCEVELEAGEED